MRKVCRTWVLAVWVSAACSTSVTLLAGTQVAAAEAIGTVAAAARSLLANGRSLAVQDSVFANERVSTDGSGRGEIVFVDGTKFAIGPSARFTVTQSLLSGKSKFKRLGLAAARGSFRWISGKSGSSAYALSTPVSTIGIRGTAIDITIRNGQAFVALLNGNVRICKNGSCQILSRACEYVELTGKGVSKKRHINAGFKSRQEAAKAFPFLARPSLLSSRFRVSGSSCLSTTASSSSQDLSQTAAATTPTPAPTPPGNTPTPPTVGGGGGGCETNCGKGKGNGGPGNGTHNEGKGNN